MEKRILIPLPRLADRQQLLSLKLGVRLLARLGVSEWVEQDAGGQTAGGVLAQQPVHPPTQRCPSLYPLHWLAGPARGARR